MYHTLCSGQHVHLYTDCVVQYHKVCIAYQCLLLVYTTSLSGTSPQFTAQPSDIIIASSSSTAINCRASGVPQPTIEWYKDNVRVTLGGRLSVNNTGALHISMVVGTDAGSYHCVASNAVGSVRSFSASLQIACKWLEIALVKTKQNKKPVVVAGLILQEGSINPVIVSLKLLQSGLENRSPTASYTCMKQQCIKKPCIKA